MSSTGGSASQGAYPLLNFIPVAALAGIMLVVVLHTFKWPGLLYFGCAEPSKREHGLRYR